MLPPPCPATLCRCRCRSGIPHIRLNYPTSRNPLHPTLSWSTTFANERQHSAQERDSLEGPNHRSSPALSLGLLPGIRLGRNHERHPLLARRVIGEG